MDEELVATIHLSEIQGHKCGLTLFDVMTESTSILVLGGNQAGKSSLINKIFQADVSGPLQIPGIQEFKIRSYENAELKSKGRPVRIIEIPSLGIPNTIEEDARILASILDEDYAILDKPPNLIIVVMKIHEENMENEVMRILQSVKTLETAWPEEKPAILYVVSNAKEVKNANENIADEVHDVISSVTGEKCPHICFLDSGPLGNLLDKIHGLLNKGTKVSEDVNKHPLSEESEDDPNVEVPLEKLNPVQQYLTWLETRWNLLPWHSSSVRNLIILHGRICHNLPMNELNATLERTWKQMNMKQFPKQDSAIVDLELQLMRNDFGCSSDLPQTPETLYDFLTVLKMQPATMALLQTIFNHEVFPMIDNTALGNFYDFTADQIGPACPFNFSGKVSLTVDGIFVPIELTYEPCYRSDIVCIDRELQDELIRDRADLLHISPNWFTTNWIKRPGYNITGFYAQDDENHTALLEIRRARLRLCRAIQLNTRFLDIIQNCSNPEGKTKTEHMTQWKAFFTEWGTHIVTGAYIGVAKNCVAKTKEDALQVAELNKTENAPNWHRLSWLLPKILDTELELAPIHEFVSRSDPILGEKCKMAMNRLFLGPLNFENLKLDMKAVIPKLKSMW